ncbi:MAG: hypothetical protein AAFS10_11845, partial [Myxococcota bacterium]
AVHKIDPRLPAHKPWSRVVCDTAELMELREALSNPGTSDTFLERYIIPISAAEAFRRGDWTTFIEKRQQRLVNMERNFLNGLGLELEPDTDGQDG